MVDVFTKIQIRCPVALVSEYASNPDNEPNWYENIKSVEWKTPKPVQIGSRVAFVAHFLGKKLTYVYEFIELIPHKKLFMRTAEGPFPMETTYTWQAIDDNITRMTLRNKGIPVGLSKLFAPFIKIMVIKANQKDLKLLKQVLEK